MDIKNAKSGAALVRQAYERYLNAFINDDMDTVEQLIHYPLTYIGDGEVHTLDAFPVSPAKLREQKQWHSTINSDFSVSLVTPTKAHVILHSAERVRKDGSLIETVSAFYAFTKQKTENGDPQWKIFAISDIVIPA